MNTIRMNKMNKNIISLFMVLTMTIFVWSCDDNSSTEPEMGSNSTIKGRVTNNPGYGDGLQKVNGSIEGATVTAAEIESDGSLRTVSNSSAQTNAEGEFNVESSVSGKENMVIVASKASSEWKAVVSSKVESNSENYSQPLNDESTAEADVFAEVVSSNETNTTHYSDVAFYVDSDIAARIKNNTTTSAEVKNAIVTEAEAESNTLASSYFGYSNSDINSKSNVEANAQVNLESDLYFSNDTETAYDQAWDAYFEAVVSGYNNTNIEMSDYAKSKEISGKAMTEITASLNSDVEFALLKRDAYLKAVLITEATVREYEHAGADDEQQQEARNEGNSLKASIRAAGSINAINDAYVQYRSNMKAHMKNTFSANATAFAAVESAIESSVKTALRTSISVATNTNALITAYSTFYSSIDSTLRSNLTTESDSKIEAYSNIYAMIYMHN